MNENDSRKPVPPLVKEVRELKQLVLWLYFFVALSVLVGSVFIASNASHNVSEIYDFLVIINNNIVKR